MSVQQVNHEQLLQLLVKAYEKKRALFVQGPTGIGKSYTTIEASKALAKMLNLDGITIWPDFDVEKFNVVDLRISQMDAVDLRGLPHEEEGRLTWLPPDFLALPEETKGIYLFDEINLAPPLIQSACYTIVYDRRSGNRKLPEGMGIVAAGNRIEDRAAVFEMAKPLANRFLHCELQVPTEERWTNWAMDAGIDSRIVGFIKQNPSFLYKFDEDPTVKAFPTPRSWHFCSEMIVGVESPEEVQFYAATSVGPAAASQFMGFVKLTATIDVDRVWNSPDKAKLPQQPAELYALTSALSERFRNKPEEQSLRRVYKLAKRLPAEFGVLLLRMTKPTIPEKLRPKVKSTMRELGIAEKFGKYLIPNTS